MIKKSIRIKLTSLREATNDSFFGQLLGDEPEELYEDELEEEQEDEEIAEGEEAVEAVETPVEE